ncbi:acyltransferase [Arcanobacterium phocisimile]|uniref:Acyltransferase n=1 Tax=Arcanobacterium phocisimile TaxID=1302235 RepID=A0ABX7IF33_9ACTO|nr:acyltransferase family protein [Arcanobacterium phocisimile]QRV01746.1 acyltransferase [Arcanobacterium phocisimile]
MNDPSYSLRTPRSARTQATRSARPASEEAKGRSRDHGRTRQQTANSPSTRLASFFDRGGYIAGLDGLRAIAVLAVIAYHVWPGIFQGGFLGVDMFFVISGFLITTLLLREDRTNNFINLGQFWVRRARRLVPALLLLIITVVPTAWAVNSDLIVGIGRQILGVLTFSTNWLEIAHGTSYFDGTAPMLFKNFWSLAIEEQFYLFWPLLMLVILALVDSLRIRIAISLSMMLASSLLMLVLYSGENNTRLYYGTDTHIFGLCAGITLAFLWASARPQIFTTAHWRSFHALYGWSAAITLGIFIFIMPDNGPWAYMGGMLIASIATVFVIADMLYPNSFMAQCGEISVLRWVGSRSYGLYLWHWPILVLAAAIYPVAVGSWAQTVRSLIAVVLTAIIVELSYRFIETPVRRHGYRATIFVIRSQIPANLRATSIMALAGVLAVVTMATVVFAPAKTSTQEMIEAGQSEQGAGADSVKESSEKAKTTQGEANKPAGTPRKDRPTTLSDELDTTIPNTYEVTIIGDSMVSASRTGLLHAMPGVNTIGEPSTQWAQAHDMIAQAEQENKLGRVVVLDYGTNAGVNNADLIRDAIEQLGQQRMILIANIYSPSTFVEQSNQLISQVVDEYPNVELVDWYSLAADRPELLQVDSTHTSIEGANAYGDLIKETITVTATKFSAARGVKPGTGWETEPPAKTESTEKDATARSKDNQ